MQEGGQTLFKQLIRCVNSWFLLNLLVNNRHPVSGEAHDDTAWISISQSEVQFTRELRGRQVWAHCSRIGNFPRAVPEDLLKIKQGPSKQTRQVWSPMGGQGHYDGKVTQICLIDYFLCPLGLVLQEVQKSIGYIPYKSQTLKTLTMWELRNPRNRKKHLWTQRIKT